MKMLCLMRRRFTLSRALCACQEVVWGPDTPKGRDALARLMELGNRHYGDETHWIEERFTDGPEGARQPLIGG